MAGRRTEKKGSMALIVCVNDTATLPRLMFVKRLPMLWTIARGRIARSWKIRTITADVHLVTLYAYRKFMRKLIFTCAPEIFGLFRIPMIHMNRAMTVPTVNCTVVMFMGYGKAFKTCRAQGQFTGSCPLQTTKWHLLWTSNVVTC
jgi:hypothetical protein